MARVNYFVLSSIVLLATVFAAPSFADHGPRIQFIHNVPTEAAASIDIWYKSAQANFPPYKLFEGVKYKEATAFATYGLIYGDLTFYVTPAGNKDTSGYLFEGTFGRPLIDYEKTFVIVLTGDSTANFNMVLNDGLEEALNSSRSSVNIFHGSFDAPSIYISSDPGGTIVKDFKYSQSTDYINLRPLEYFLTVEVTDGPELASFTLPLNLFTNKAVFIVATGYLDTSGATPNEPFKLLLVEPDGTVTQINPFVEDAGAPRLQIIHNSAANAAAKVDVWVTDAKGSYRLLSNFAYKDATPYIDVTGSFTVSITPVGSVDTSSAILNKSFFLNQGASYVVVAAGDPGANFDLFIADGLEEVSEAGKTALKVFHGSVGAPTVDVDEVSIPGGVIVNNLSFGQSKGYLNLASSDYKLQIKTQEGIGAAEFAVPLSLFKDSVLFVAATGYLNTTGLNSFKLLVVTPSGNVIELNPEDKFTPARIQLIHNCAVPATDFVDVYLDDNKILDDFEFRTSTPFIEVPGATRFTVDIDTRSSFDNSFPIFSDELVLESGRTYVVMASGVIIFGSENYFPPKEFELIPIAKAREASINSEKVDVMVFHGITDAPTVDINELETPVDELVNDIKYGTSQGYIELDPTEYELEIALASSATSVRTFDADISSFKGQAITIVASGFLDPIKNNNGASFGLWVSLPKGGDLIELKRTFTSVDEKFIDDETALLYPNPATDFINLNYTLKESSDVNIFVYDLNGMELKSISYTNLQKSNQITTLNLKDLSNGLYLIKIQAGQSVITRKIQINK